MMPDYVELMDAETWAFIDRTNAFYPPQAVDWSITRSRETYNRMAKAFHAGHPPGINVETSAIETPTHVIPIRIYSVERSDPPVTILYFHGGGFALGDLDSHDDVCAEICAGTGLTVVSVAYRLVPEHLATAAFDDAVVAYDWASVALKRPVLLAGDSAGGNIAACLANHVALLGRRPQGQVLIYPQLGADFDQGSYVTHAQAPLLSIQEVIFFQNLRAGGIDCSADLRLTPLAGDSFSYLPPTFIFTAQCDPLSSDGTAYYERLHADGVRVSWHEEEGLPHGYLRARHSVSRARAAMERIVQALLTLAGSKTA